MPDIDLDEIGDTIYDLETIKEMKGREVPSPTLKTYRIPFPGVGDLYVVSIHEESFIPKMFKNVNGRVIKKFF